MKSFLSRLENVVEEMPPGLAVLSLGAVRFPDELCPVPRRRAEQAFPKLIHFNKLPKGGHFAAWEQSELLSEEVHAGFRSLR